MVAQPYVELSRHYPRLRPPAHLVVPARSSSNCTRQSRGITIMNAQILAADTDCNYAAALDWIEQTAASGKTLSPPESAKEELVAALITSEHATAIVAQQIRERLRAPRPAPAQGVAPADHGTYSEICTGCGRYYDLSAEADQVMRVAVQQDGRVLVQCKDTGACYERWNSIVTFF